MKKITLMVAAVALSFSTYAQTNVSSATNGVHTTVVAVNPQVSLAPCSQMEASNGFENGFGSTNATTEVADDLTVTGGEAFSVERATLNMITAGTYPSVTLRFYDDAGGLPGGLVMEYADIIPTSQDDIGDAFGRDVLAVVVDLPAPLVLPSVGGSDTTYWMSIFTPNGTGADSFWETSTASSSTINTAFKDGTDPTAAWANTFDPGTGVQDMPPAAVFLVEGECDPLLGVEDNLQNLVSIFPNPVSNVLNVNVPADITIQSVTMFDILGKDTGVNIVNGTINTSNLAKGVYILNVRTSAGTLTQKVIKR